MPDWRQYVRERLVLPHFEEAVAEDVVDDVAAQLEDHYAAALAAGASPEAAEAQALEEVVDWAALAESIQDEKGRSDAVRVDRNLESAEAFLRNRGRGWVSLADTLQTVRLSLRRLRRAPGFSIVVLATLALGIGANTAIFSVVNGILLKPLPYDAPDQLISVWTTAPAMGEMTLPQSPAVNLLYQGESQLMESFGLWWEGESTVLLPEGPTRMSAALITSGMLRALRIDPVLGRGFVAEEDLVGGPLTAMLSHSYWQNRYGGDASAIGQSITIDGRDHEVVGVMPRDFHLLASDPQIYTPFAVDPARLYLGNFSFRSLARMRDGVTIEQAQGELARLLTLAPERYPGGMSLEQLQQAQAAPLLRPLRDDVVGDVGSLLWLVFGGVGVILLIACANVANLFLVRAESRERELAVRSALGAGRRQISGQFLTESILLGLGGGVFGTGLAYAGLRLLAVLVPEDLPRAAEITIDPTVLFFTVVLSILAGMFFGVFPMLRYRRTDHVVALKEGGRGAGASRARHRTRNGLVVAQMALALVLLIGSGLMIRSFQSLRQVNPGFQTPERILAFGIAIPETEIADVETLAIQYEQIAQRVEQVPGVTSVGLTTSITMDGRGGFDPLWVQDAPVAEGQMPPLQRFKWIGPGYFETMQNPLVAGRQLDWTDVRNRLPVAMVSEAIARQYWGDAATAIGRQIATGGEPGNWREIIGVVGDVRDDGVALDPVSIVYWPMAMTNPFAEVLEGEVMVPRRLEFVVRSDRVGTAQLLTDVREAVWSINSNLPLANPRSLDVDLRASMARTSFTLVMLAIAAAMALLLGAVGVYGVISYVVSQRTREIGLRVVLGAESRSVRKMVLRQGLRLAAVGVFVGLIAGAAVTRLMSGVLYGVSPLDPLTYGLVALILTAIALLASYLPARRASRVSPMDAIRAE